MSYDNFIYHMNNKINLEKVMKDKIMIDTELAASRNVMQTISSVMELKNECETSSIHTCETEELWRYLDESPPSLLLPDMINVDIDYEKTLMDMKVYMESLKRQTAFSTCCTEFPYSEFSSDISQHALRLEGLCKNLASIKLKPVMCKRDMNLENKLICLLDNVENFTKMVQAQKTMQKCFETKPEVNENNISTYNNVLNKILSDINDILYYNN